MVTEQRLEDCVGEGHSGGDIQLWGKAMPGSRAHSRNRKVVGVSKEERVGEKPPETRVGRADLVRAHLTLAELCL